MAFTNGFRGEEEGSLVREAAHRCGGYCWRWGLQRESGLEEEIRVREPGLKRTVYETGFLSIYGIDEVVDICVKQSGREKVRARESEMEGQRKGEKGKCWYGEISKGYRNSS